MFDFFLVHWVLFAVVFVAVSLLMVIVAVSLESRRISRIQERKNVLLQQTYDQGPTECGAQTKN